MQNSSEFITGNEAAVLGAIEGGAKIMYGYPITPSTEILHGWIEKASKESTLDYLQTEDETTAGFAVIGSILAGKKSFTATAGPGTILMQDPLSMAENMRIPFVAIIMQRGGPSTGTVNFSQQEVTLSAFGGNGDGLRVVYSPSSVEEMYTLAAKAFSTAWKYRFPTIILGDGHLAKMRTIIQIKKLIKPYPEYKILGTEKEIVRIRNCFSSEEDFGKHLQENIDDWSKNAEKISEYETYNFKQSFPCILAHGSVASAVKDAINLLKKEGRNVGLIRPITLNPFPKKIAKLLRRHRNVLLIESSLNQFSRIVKYETHAMNTKIVEISKPAVSFSAEEIKDLIVKKSYYGK